MTVTVEAPITAVTVYPAQARITRRAAVVLPAGQQRIRVGDLPLGLHPDSVRVNGRGPATVLGVDVVPQVHARSPDAGVAGLEEQLRELRGRLAELADEEAVADSRAAVLGSVGRRSGAALAKALADGRADAGRVAEVNATLADQLGEVLALKRELAERRLRLQEDHDALGRTLAAVAQQQTPDRKAVLIELDVHEDGAESGIELSYVVNPAQWVSHYDVRLADERLTLTWYASITQDTGENWPECELRLSTARPAATATIPELTPWYLDRVRPVVAQSLAAQADYGMPGGAAPVGYGAAPEMAVAPATVEHGATASTYRPARTIAVPSDGSAHRTTVATVDLSARFDHVTVPVRGPEAYLRATAVNTSDHTLRPGRAAVFHGTEFVGTTRLDVWAPGEEVELNLGVDDRVRVERELVRRTAGKAVLGGTRRQEAAFRIKVGNHGPRAAKVTVVDQVPVSRDEGIVVRDVTCKPDPVERTDLGELTWRLDLAPDRTAEITVALRVDIARGVDMTGWRD